MAANAATRSGSPPAPARASRPLLFPTPPETPAPWDQHHAFLRLLIPREFASWYPLNPAGGRSASMLR
ncbi:hypothetical protein AruPA_17450 [Acidiphilium sp. PA]|uniref:hypothetical protein n=1 Tax=Acidiphilium sp. PA TaxID=2871705 RepID=UPI002243DAFD|nr:hypothetical protein [Acidiphilium sp. PA]MCW8308822.1 hypothetical protein [Acidiphilium sp. PA]